MQKTFSDLVTLSLTTAQKFPKKWDVKTHYIDLVEEVGELGNAILVESGDKSIQRQRSKLHDGFADVFFQLIQLADAAGVDLEKDLTIMLSELLKRQENGEYQDE